MKSAIKKIIKLVVVVVVDSDYRHVWHGGETVS